MKTSFWLAVLLWTFTALPHSWGQTTPANDNFADRILLTDALPINVTGTNIEAGAEYGEPSHYPGHNYYAYQSVWWSWTAQQDGLVQIDATGSDFSWALAVYEDSASDPDILVDNSDATGVTFTGAWTTSKATAGFVGSNYSHDGNNGKGTKSVRFTPTIKTAGAYDVYMRWSADTNRATNVPVDVVHAAGTSTFNVNERTNGGSWVKLNGSPLTFAAGTAASVLIRTDGTDGYVIADAVRFVPVISFPDLSRVRVSDGENPVSFYAKAGRSYQIAVDDEYYGYSGDIDLSIQASTAPAITSPPDVSTGVNQSFSYQITANNAPTSYDVSGLPDGLTYDPYTGIISGTPYYTGDAFVYLTASSNQGNAYGSLDLSVAALQPVVNSATDADATQGQSFTYQITATKNPTSFRASGLPDGLTVDAASGLISGAPTVSGYFNIDLSASNSYGFGDLYTLYLNIAAATPVVTGGSATVNVGAAFTYHISATKSPTSYDATGLPSGLSVDQTTGIISGTPTTTGSFGVVISASNSWGPGSNVLTLDVLDLSSDAFATRLPLQGTSVSIYSSNVDATKEPGEPEHAGDPGGASLWWTWTAPQTGQYQISVDSDFATLFAVYQGTSLANLKEVVSNRDLGNGSPITMVFEAIAGHHYQLAVDGSFGTTGSFALTIDLTGKNMAEILDVTTTGRGSVTAGFLGTSFRQLGQSYTIVAKPAPGYAFSGWSGGIVSSSPRLTFSMQDGLALEADFIPSSLVTTKGSYHGLIQNSDTISPSTSGAINLSIGSFGAFTASFTFGGHSYSLHGTFDQNGSYFGTIPRGSQWPLSVYLNVDPTNLTGGVTGSLSDDVIEADIAADFSTASATINPVSQAGRYTVLASSEDFEGDGYGVVTVDNAGTIRFIGVLPDGTRVSQGGVLSDLGTWACYIMPGGGKDFVTGIITFAGNDFDGAMSWQKPATLPDQSDGFSSEFDFSGARYAAPPAGNRVLDFGNGDGSGLASIDEDESQGLANEVGIVIDPNNKVVADVGSGLTITITTANGLFSGTYRDPSSNKVYKFAGAFLQDQFMGGGLIKVGNFTTGIYLQSGFDLFTQKRSH